MDSFSLCGSYGEAKIFTTLIDDRSISDIFTMLCQPFTENQTVRIMPDVHAGEGCVIGTTLTIFDKVCPSIVGVDIGCGVYAIKLKEDSIDFSMLDDIIRQYIPYGFAIHKTPLPQAKNINIESLFCMCKRDPFNDFRAIGTLGGGNHFIEVDYDSHGCLWLVVHSGSRHLGLYTAHFYQNMATLEERNSRKNKRKKIIADLKLANKEKEIFHTLKEFSALNPQKPKEFCWCSGSNFKVYVHDMKIVQNYADINRRTIADIIMSNMNLHKETDITTVHNYIDMSRMILRKGAVAAENGQQLIIPMNMRDGSLICVGKGNPEWNYSAPHGAGRLLSRSEAKKQIGLQEYITTMKDVWSTSVNINTIDESPMAYKPIEKIVDNIKDTVDIVDIIKPLYNFKA